MSNEHQYSPEAKAELAKADNMLSEAMSKMKSEPSEEPSEESSLTQVETEAEPQQIQAEEPSEAPQKKESVKKRGSDFVEINDPHVKERLDYLYLQAKSSDEKNKLLIDHNRRLQEAVEKIQSKFTTIEHDTLQRQEIAEINGIKAQLKEAMAIGDYDRTVELQDALVELRTTQKGREVEKEAVIKEPPAPPKLSKQDIADANYVEFLATEKDSVGNLKRPYLQGWHPENQKAATEAAKIANEFVKGGRAASVAEVMKELDRRMSPNQSKGDPVLSGNNNNSSNSSEIKLTAEQRMIAKKMGVSEKDYARELQIIQQSQNTKRRA